MKDDNNKVHNLTTVVSIIEKLYHKNCKVCTELIFFTIFKITKSSMLKQAAIV